MEFAKMHGCGNDYIYINGFKEKVAHPAALSRAVSDRHFGIGADGLILILPSKKADFRMRIFNADGSEAQMCGNGLRCFGKYVYEHGLTSKTRFSIETGGGTVHLQLFPKRGKVSEAEINMGAPHPVPQEFFAAADGRKTLVVDALKVADREFTVHVLSIGNPHCVIFVDDVEHFPLEKYGPLLERHTAFAQRTNVEFVEVVNKHKVKQRTWERGSGETLACGSGACAVMATLFLTKRTGRKVIVQLRGGTLYLRYATDGTLHLRGPAVEVCTGEIHPALLNFTSLKVK